ncbi:hypothetical protein [Aurantivibrio plasticivorans]
MNAMQTLLDFLNRLEEAELPYTLEHNSESTILVLVAIEGERWEIEFSAEGEMQVEVFYSGETAEGSEAEETIERLFLDFDEDDDEDDDADEEWDDDLDDDDDELDTEAEQDPQH